MKRSLFVLLILSLLFAPSVAAGSPKSAGSDLPTEALVASQRARLAASGRFYLELLLSKKEIRLCHSGVWVASYPLLSVKAGYPRVLFFPLGKHQNWIGEIWTDARLDPPAVTNRVEIVPGDDSTIPTPDESDVLPPTLQELIPVPRVYDIRFDDGRVIRVMLEGKIPGAVKKKWRIAGRWKDFLAAVGLKPKDKVRLMVTLTGKEGAALYRSFPDKPASLLVVP